MSDDDQLHALGQKLADALTASYGVAAPGAHLVFLPGGASVPDDIVQIGLINPTQMQTWLSINFDSPFIISAADCAVHQKDPSHGSASRIYTVAATTAQPVGHPDDDSWKRVSGQIAAAQRSLGPPDGQKLIVCEPDDWVLPSNAGYWNTFDSTQTETTTSTAATVVNQAARCSALIHLSPRVKPQFWMVRSLAAEPITPEPHPELARGSDVVALSGGMIKKPEPPPRVGLTPAVLAAMPVMRSPASPSATWSASRISGRASATPVSSGSALTPTPRTVVQSEITALGATPVIAAKPMLATYRFAADRGQLATINTLALFATAKPVLNVTTTTSSAITVHLEHQCVALGYYNAGQPWWDGVFLADTGWFIPGMSRGGLLPVPDGPGDGLGYGLPMAMIIVRNLRVSGKWSAEAAAALSSPGGTIGPLSLFGATAKTEADGVTVTYAHDGMQVVALLCSAIPILPPVDPPSP
jgi:hypothetical protein